MPPRDLDQLLERRSIGVGLADLLKEGDRRRAEGHHEIARGPCRHTKAMWHVARQGHDGACLPGCPGTSDPELNLTIEDIGELVPWVAVKRGPFAIFRDTFYDRNGALPAFAIHPQGQVVTTRTWKRLGIVAGLDPRHEAMFHKSPPTCLSSDAAAPQ